MLLFLDSPKASQKWIVSLALVAAAGNEVIEWGAKRTSEPKNCFSAKSQGGQRRDIAASAPYFLERAEIPMGEEALSRDSGSVGACAC